MHKCHDERRLTGRELNQSQRSRSFFICCSSARRRHKADSKWSVQGLVRIADTSVSRVAVVRDLARGLSCLRGCIPVAVPR